MKTPSPQAEVLTGLLRKYPQAYTKTLARIAFRDHPKLFRSLEYARDGLRYLRGANGTKKRQQRISLKGTALFRAPQKPGNPFGAIPEGIDWLPDWAAVEIPGPLRALILSDIHFPFHERTPLVAALREGRKFGADLVILNGDAVDFFSISRFQKKPELRDFAFELDMMREFNATLRSLFPKARIIHKQGNHEERWQSYMLAKCEECYGVEEFQPKSLLHLDKYAIEWIGDKKPIRLGHLNVLHGHEYAYAWKVHAPVNPARGLFLRAKCHALCGHFHWSSHHSEKTVQEDVIGTWSTGCLCNLHPDYAPLNPWNHGFALVEVFNDGRFNVVNRFIGAGGKVY